MKLSRRNLIAAGVAAAATPAIAAAAGKGSSNAARFSLGYAPHEGSFASRGGLLEQIAYAADQGFRAWEDNEARKRPIEQQEAMARALAQRGMTMGVFVASMPKWAEFRPLLGSNDDAEREAFLADIRTSVEVAKRLNAKHATVVTGFMDRKVPQDIQTGRIIDCMRRAGDIVAPHGLTLVMEPLNTRTNHPGVYMQSIAQGWLVLELTGDPLMLGFVAAAHLEVEAVEDRRLQVALFVGLAQLRAADDDVHAGILIHSEAPWPGRCARHARPGRWSRAGRARRPRRPPSPRPRPAPGSARR